MGLDRQTSVRLVLYESLLFVQRNTGRSRLTWITIIEKDLAFVEIKSNNTSSEIRTETTGGFVEGKSLCKQLMKDIMMIDHGTAIGHNGDDDGEDG